MILTKYRLRLTLCLAITATVLTTTHANAAEDTVTYSLRITDAPHHLAQVAAKFPPTDSVSMDFIMPAWRLGKYKILNMANGNLIVVDHGNGWQTLYAHLNSISAGCGQSVNQGQRIGGLGNTGNSSGAHLHFEMIYVGVKVNPWNFLQ